VASRYFDARNALAFLEGFEVGEDSLLGCDGGEVGESVSSLITLKSKLVTMC